MWVDIQLGHQLLLGLPVFDQVGVDALGLMAFYHGVIAAIGVLEPITHFQNQPGQWRSLEGVGSVLTDGGEVQIDASTVDFDHDTQTEFYIRMADPALPESKFSHETSKKSDLLLRRAACSSSSTGKFLISATFSATRGR